MEQASELREAKASAQERHAEVRKERDRLYGERENGEGEARELAEIPAPAGEICVSWKCGSTVWMWS